MYREREIRRKAERQETRLFVSTRAAVAGINNATAGGAERWHIRVTAIDTYADALRRGGWYAGR